uniref:RAD17 checkpoint clamp loader component n=2 Tax=Aplocheiloidei TaxID=45443 RepID=A0A3Q3BE78_KRYMA
MKTHMDASKAGILILTGPSGCGKTATVHVLSQELGIRVQEWTNTFNLEPYSSMNVFSCSSQIVQFQDFLLRANKYRCLKMAGDEEATDRKLTLVEDFPNQFYRQPRSLHDMLRCFVRRPQYPLVFVVSDCPSGDGRLQSLFPREIQKELAISCISFNPVPPTTMMKALSCILSLETGKARGEMFVPDKTELEALCAGSSGDLRSAINSLQFLCLPGEINKRPAISKDRTVSRANKKMKMTKQMKEQEEHQAIGGKDASLFLFRALGKILHSKPANETTGPPGPGLSFHLSHHHREPLLINPELVLERSQMSAEVFSLYLHQNYLDFFCDMEDVDRASEYLSDADLLSADWTSRSILGEYGSSVVSRGLLHSNSHQVSSGFRPLHKPSWFLVSRKVLASHTGIFPLPIVAVETGLNLCGLETIPVTVSETSAPPSRYFGPLLISNCSSCLRFEGCLFQTACFSSFQRCSIAFRSELIEGHFRIVQCFPLSHSWVFLAVCFGSLSCCKTHDLRLRRSFLTLGSTFLSRIQ